jgi:Reverse transcriptase (RNA-dependent DNA polymerase)
VCALQELITQYRKKKKHTPIVAFLDIKAAYDSVDRRYLYQALERMELPKSMIQIVRALSENNMSRVVINGRESKEFVHRAGVMQGSVLSPCLYSAFVNGLAEELVGAGELPIENTTLSTFLYADDMAIVADNDRQMQKLLDICEKYSIGHRFRFNPRKCEVFGSEKLRLYGEPLPKTDLFKYLGVWFRPWGIDWKTHVGKMIEKARNSAQFFGHVGYNGTGFRERTKLTIYKTFIRPMMEYGLAIMPEQGNKHLIKKLDQEQHRMICRMFGVHWNTSMANVRAHTGVLPFYNRHEELRGKWGVDMVKKSSRFAVYHAYAAHIAKPLPKSCFAGLAENRLFMALGHDSHGQHADEARKPSLWQTRLNYRIEVMKQQVQESSRPEAFLTDMDNNRPLQLRELSRQPDSIRRLCNLWMLGKLMGKPPYCFVCNRRVTIDHMEKSCVGRAFIDQQLKRLNFEVAAKRIQHMMKALIIDGRFLHWMTIRIGIG